jgi:hypothetical protein
MFTTANLLSSVCPVWNVSSKISKQSNSKDYYWLHLTCSHPRLSLWQQWQKRLYIYELNPSAEFCSHVAHHLALSPGPIEQCSLHLAQCAVCQPVPFARWLSSGTKLVTLIIWQKLQSNGCVTPQLVINVPGPCCSGSVDVLHTGKPWLGEWLFTYITRYYTLLHDIVRYYKKYTM